MLAGVAFAPLAKRFADSVAPTGFAQSVAHFRTKCTVLLLALMLLPGVYDTMDSHPFGMSFYNAAIGGTRGAWRHGFEATYWGDAFFQVLPFLNEHAPCEVLVIPGTVDWLFRHYQRLGMLRDDIRITRDDFAGADFVIFHARQSEMTDLAKRLLERGKFARAVRYGGATIAAVVKREDIEPQWLREAVASTKK